MHLDQIIQGVTPRTRTSGAEHEGEATTPGLQHPGKWGRRRRMSGKKTPNGIKEKEDTKEDARGLDQLGSDAAPDWIIRGGA